MIMHEVYEFTRLINESNCNRRISEYAYSGIVDDDGEFKLTGYTGHIHPARAIETASVGIREEITAMSIKSQQANMKAIHSLVSQDLGYIHGERESGPNGAKKVFLTKSAAFLRALAKDLGFAESKITTNPGGIAVSGEVMLRGMWSRDNGLYMQIFQSVTQRQEFLYRSIKHMKDYSGSPNQWLSCSMFAAGEYEGLIDTLLELRKPSSIELAEIITPGAVYRHVA